MRRHHLGRTAPQLSDAIGIRVRYTDLRVESAVLVNAELRWSIFDGGYVLGQHLRPMLAPFVDAGRVFDGTQLRFDGWRADYGIGFRLIWNLVTTVSFDYGISSEGVGLPNGSWIRVLSVI